MANHAADTHSFDLALSAFILLSVPWSCVIAEIIFYYLIPYSTSAEPHVNRLEGVSLVCSLVSVLMGAFVVSLI